MGAHEAARAPRARDWCQGSRTCVALHPIAPDWVIGKTTMDGVRVTGVVTNPMRGLRAMLDDGRRQRLDDLCVQGAETDAWKKLIADHEGRERQRKQDSAESKARWQKLFPDAGISELRPIPMPSFQIGR